MAGYRRFVTYLFQYEQNQKRGNCGFAKVEVQQDRCRVILQAKSDYTGSFHVYLYARESDMLKGAFLGDISVRNGSGEAAFVFAPERIGGTPYGIDDMQGLYLAETDEAFIASQWDDGETDWTRFSPYRAEDREEEKAPASAEKEEESQEKYGKEPLMNDAKVLRGGDTPEKQGDKGQGKQEEKAQIQDEENDREQEKHYEQEQKDGEEGAELKSTQVSEAPRLVYRYEETWERQWQRFCALHPMFLPYDEDALVWGVKMDLKDFKLLPEKFRFLANNSFLLHGFFNYRYIVFGYEGEEEKRWFLGVPGVFQNQEQLLAGIFGFPEFRTRQNCVQRTGEFGYWYRYLEL